METEFRLTGKHVLVTMISFFLVILVVNIVFINFAVKTFPGEKEEKSYLQGLNYNDRLTKRAEQATLGWRVTIENATLTGDRVQLTVTVNDADGAPLSGLFVTGILSRPASAIEDQPFAFKETSNGEYIASLSSDAGVWDLEGKATNLHGDEFDFSSRLILQ